MSDRKLLTSTTGCSSPEISSQLSAYCFEDVPDSERRLFEAHLLDCDLCWSEVHRLGAGVQALRADKELLRTASVTDVSSVLGISAKLDWLMGGHLPHVLLASALYALSCSLMLPIEVAYAFDRFAPVAMKLTPIVFLWVFLTSALAFTLDWKNVLSGHGRGLVASTTTFLVSSAILYVGVWKFLPSFPVTQLRIQAYTAQAAYLKDILYFLPLAIAFMVVPFHLVVMLQRELQAGRHRLTLALISGERWAVSPAGTFYLSARTLWIFFVVAVLASIPMLAHLLDNLVPGPFMNLFVHLLQIRWALSVALGLECLGWYSRALNEVKRESVAVEMSSARLS